MIDPEVHISGYKFTALVDTDRLRVRAKELEEALSVLSIFDEGPDLVLFFKHLMVLKGHPEFALHFNETDALTDSQRGFAEAQLKLFDALVCRLVQNSPAQHGNTLPEPK